MNEDRIREIANLASTHAESTVDPFWDLEDGLDYPARRLKVRDLKFTELIVTECGVALAPMLRDMVSRGKAYDMIKKHFGVE